MTMHSLLVADYGFNIAAIRTPNCQTIQSDACFDGEFSYTILGLDGKNLPEGRGPILRLKIPIKDLLHSLDSENCGFRYILQRLDTKEHMLTDHYETALVDLQLFLSKRHNGTFLPFIIKVSQKIQSTGGESSAHSTFLAVAFDRAQDPSTDGPLNSEDESSDSREEEAEGPLENEDESPVSSEEEAEGPLENEDESPDSSEEEAEGPLENEDESPDSSEEEAEALMDTYGLAELKEWLQECEISHLKCALLKQSKLPMRVLNVLGLGDSDLVKLRETMDRPYGHYFALSYVWGKKPSIRLLQATRNEFMGGVALEKLPKTLQDAVLVTRSLNVQYLWIDALCVCQDSDSDKETQIPYMNEYYRDAVAVISASGAADVYAGFLQPQRTSSDVLTRAENQVIYDHSEYGPIHHRIPYPSPGLTNPILLTVDTEPILYNYDEEPINKRGWTLQESALARRLITFLSTGGIVLRCHDGEKLAGEIMSDPYHEDPAFAYPDALDHSQRSQTELFRNWARIVQDYSQRSLSYPGDILVALGALALESQNQDGSVLGSYVAGLWMDSLREGLLWHISSPPHPDRDTYLPPRGTVSQYYAPSWSWASCGHPVVFRTEREPYMSFGNYEKEEPSWCAEIMDFKVFPQSERNPLGAVKNGHIDIKGSLVPIRRVSKSDDLKPDKCDVGDIALNTNDEYEEKPQLFAPDSIDSLALIDWSCSWLPLYDATRGRCRGLIVREINPGRFRRLGFAVFPSRTLEELRSE
ncbi:MAG: hypothetical protein Q9221_007346 [Calogaya cf. arnoldii]